MTLFVFLVLALIVVAIFYVNQTKLDQPPYSEPAPKPVAEPEPVVEPIVESEPPKPHRHTYRTRYVIAIGVTVLLIAATVIESVFFS